MSHERPEYVIGGVDANENLLDSVEAIAVTPFGQPGQAQTMRQTDPISGERVNNNLRKARSNLQAVTVQNNVYVIGGAIDDGNGGQQVSNSVERAKILGLDSVPGFINADYLDGNGKLPAGSWYYRISAISQSGEGLPSRELIVRNQNMGAIQLDIEAFPDAMFYNIYRSPAADGRAQSGRLIAQFSPTVSGSYAHFVDDGTGPLAPAPGFLNASASDSAGTLLTGFYAYQVAAEVSDGQGGSMWTRPGYRTVTELSADNGAVDLSWDPIPEASAYRLYRSALSDDGQGICYLLQTASLTDTNYVDSGDDIDTNSPADDGIAPLPRGSLSLFTELPESMQLNTAREGGEAFVLDTPNIGASEDEPSYRSFIFYVSGRSSRGSISIYEPSSERVEISLRGDDSNAPGDLLGWEYEYNSPGDASSGLLQLETGRAFFGLVSNAGSHGDPVPPVIEDPCSTPELRDQDGDHYDSVDCGGTDCDDTNANINPGIQELPWPLANMCENGIDEDCDGQDTWCIQGFTSPPDLGDTLIENNEQVFVSVLYGSKAQTGTGGETPVVEANAEHLFESSFINREGHLMSWTFNEKPNGTYQKVIGLEALLYFNYLYAVRGYDISGIGGNIDRYPACPPGSQDNEQECRDRLPADPTDYDVENDLILGKQSTSASTSHPHAFFSMERIYSRVFAIGGYSTYDNSDGTGTVSDRIEQAQQ